MTLILLILFSIFVAGNIATEWRNQKALPWASNPISAYLADVPWAIAQDAGFLALTIALFILSAPLTLAHIPFLIAACALPFVVLTKYYIAFADTPATDKAIAERLHVILAGIAFTGTTVSLLLLTWHDVSLANGAAMAAVAVAFLFYRFAPSCTAVEEKAVTACIMVSLYAFVIAG